MASGKRFEMVMDFLVNLKSDKTQADKITKELEKQIPTLAEMSLPLKFRVRDIRSVGMADLQRI